jgi:hypothetical protein
MDTVVMFVVALVAHVVVLAGRVGANVAHFAEVVLVGHVGPRSSCVRLLAPSVRCGVAGCRRCGAQAAPCEDK